MGRAEKLFDKTRFLNLVVTVISIGGRRSSDHCVLEKIWIDFEKTGRDEYAGGDVFTLDGGDVCESWLA